MIASIGPFYYSTPDLQDMEAQKLKFLHRMLKENDKLDLLSCLHGAMKELETQTRKLYLEDFSRINSDDFVQMMLVGGTFIIELFRLNAKVNKSSFIPNDYHLEPALRRSLSNKYRDLPMKGNSTKLVLRNLLAYEQCNSYAAPYFTSLVLLFSSLINTGKDVELLRGAGIIKGEQKK
ncbi:hypothetical protein REPUB_Repub18cG0061200 [Reevesia pubescens]